MATNAQILDYYNKTGSKPHALAVANQGSSSGAIGDEFDVFLITGQSNAVGFGEPVVAKLDFNSENIWQYCNSPNNLNGTIIPATPQLYHYDGEANLVGFPLYFAREYYKYYNRKVLLIPCAKGGSGFNSFGWNYPNGELIVKTVRIMNEILSVPGRNFKGILWHQGETDVGMASSYATSLDGLVNHFRNNIRNASEIPFIAGTLSADFIGDPQEEYEFKRLINQAIENLPNRLPKTETVNMVGMSGNSPVDKIHFSAESQRIIGKKYFQKYQKIVGNRKPIFRFPLKGTFNDLYGVHRITRQTGTFVNDSQRGLCLEMTQGGQDNHWLRVNCGINLNSFTKMMWVKINSGSTINMLFSSNGRPFNIFTIQNVNFTGSGSNFTLKHVFEQKDFINFQCDSSRIFPFGVWVHVCCTFDKSTGQIFMYENGEVVFNAINTNISDGYDNAFLKIGSDNGEAWNSVNGRMQDVIYADYAMSQNEILSYMNG